MPLCPTHCRPVPKPVTNCTAHLVCNLEDPNAVWKHECQGLIHTPFSPAKELSDSKRVPVRTQTDAFMRFTTTGPRTGGKQGLVSLGESSNERFPLETQKKRSDLYVWSLGAWCIAPVPGYV